MPEKDNKTELIAGSIDELSRGSWRTAVGAVLGDLNHIGEHMNIFPIKGTGIMPGLHLKNQTISVHANSIDSLSSTVEDISIIIDQLRAQRPEWLRYVKMESFLLAREKIRERVIGKVIGDDTVTENACDTPTWLQTLAFTDLNVRALSPRNNNTFRSWKDLGQMGEIIIDLGEAA